MHAYTFKKASTNISVELEIVDSTDGTPETGVVWNTAGIALEYRRDGAVSVAITEATLAALTTAHADGGFLHIGNGVYRLDLPDAALATGADKVVIHGTVTGMVVIPAVIQLVDYDPFDAVRMGMTALPDAAADAAGGLPISDAGGLDLDAEANTAFFTTPATLVDLVWDEVLTGGTHNINNSAGKRLRQVDAAFVLHAGTAQAGGVNTITLDATASAIDDFYNHTRVVISGGTGAEQTAIIVDYVGATKVAKIAPSWTTAPDNTSEYEIEPAICHAETGWATIKIGLAAAGAASTITLDSDASATTDYYKDDVILIDKGTGEGQGRVITAYNGTTKVATVSEAWDITPDTTSEYIVEQAHAVVEVNNDKTGYALSAAGVDAIWDESLVAHQTALTAGRAMTLGGVPIAETTATGTPTTSSVQIVAGSTIDNYYIDQTFKILSGSGVGQAKIISGYVGATKTCSFDEPFIIAPSSGDAVAIQIDHVHPVSQIQAGLATAAALATVDTVVDGIQTDLSNATDGLGAIKADTAAILVDTGTTIPATLGTPTAADLATDIANIQTDVNTTNTSIGLLNDLSAANVNAEMLDVMSVDTFSESTAVPAAISSLSAKMSYVFDYVANKQTQTATTHLLRNRADSATISTATVSDDGTTAIKGTET